MSTKTLRKRIALVAVSAMGFGLLTSVSAHATWTDWATNGDFQDNASVGLVGPITGGSNLTAKATLLNTGLLKVQTGGDDTISGIVVSSGAVITKTATMTKLATTQSCVDELSSTEIKPTGAAGTTFTVSGYTGGTCAAGLTGLKAVLTVTIASSSDAGTPSAANSAANWTTSGGAPTVAGVDDTGKSSTTRGLPLYLYVLLKDVYSAPIKSAGAMTAEVGAGAVVSIKGSTAPSADGTYTTAVTSDKNDDGIFVVRVAEKTAGTGWSGTVKVSFNGVVIATKSGTIKGDITKISASATAVGKKSNDTTDAIEYQAYDAAGNIVTVSDSTFTLGSSSSPAVVTGITQGTNNSASTGAAGQITVTCGSAGSSDVVLSYVNEAGAIIKTNPVKFLCGDKAATYTASWDKASYKQGDIAKLTVKFLDAKGNAANSTDAVSDSPSADQVISAPQMTRVTQAAGLKAGATVDETGSITYTFTVGTDSGAITGSYNAVVSFPTVNGFALGGANQAAAYAITSSGASISNAEVLAAIVKLIASINKQITALQKLLTKKK